MRQEIKLGLHVTEQNDEHKNRLTEDERREEQDKIEVKLRMQYAYVEIEGLAEDENSEGCSILAGRRIQIKSNPLV